MTARLGYKVNETRAAKWLHRPAPVLLPGEEMLALARCNNVQLVTAPH